MMLRQGGKFNAMSLYMRRLNQMPSINKNFGFIAISISPFFGRFFDNMFCKRSLPRAGFPIFTVPYGFHSKFVVWPFVLCLPYG